MFGSKLNVTIDLKLVIFALLLISSTPAWAAEDRRPDTFTWVDKVELAWDLSTYGKTETYWRIIVPKILDQIFAVTGVQQPPIYMIQKPGVPPSFLLGTLHVGVAAAELPHVVLDKMTGARSAYFEIVSDPEWRKLKPDELAASEVRQLRSIWAQVEADPNKKQLSIWAPTAIEVEHMKRLGIPENIAKLIFTGMDPSFMFEEMGYKYQRPHGMDVQLQTLAENARVPIMALETFEKRDAAHAQAAAAGKAEKQQTLRDFLKSLDDVMAYLKGVRNMVNAYRDGSAVLGDEKSADDDCSVQYRNAEWMASLEHELANGNIFVSVGKYHLYGEKGLIELIRSKGYSIALWKMN